MNIQVKSTESPTPEQTHRLTQYIPCRVSEQIGLIKDKVFDERVVELKGCVVYFDIIGFTTIALTYLNKNKDIADLSETLSEFYSVMTEAVRGFNGSIFQFAGDSLLITFDQGKDEPPSANIQRALGAIQTLKGLCDNYNQVNEKDNGFSLKAKIGISYGTFYQMILGSTDYYLTPIISGPAHASAIACEKNCTKQEIVLNEETWKLCEPLGIQNLFEKRGDFYHMVKEKEIMSETAYDGEYISLDQFFDDPSFYQNLSRFINPLILQQIQSGFTGFSGEYREITCMMVHFEGDFSTPDSDFNPNLFFNQIDAIYRLVNEKAFRYGAYCTKPDISDKGVVFPILFGTPNVIEYKEQNSILLAAELKQSCTKLPFVKGLHMGISTGTAYTGEFGGYLRKDYTSIGNPLNFASRLMSSISTSKSFSILLDSLTKEMTSMIIETEEIRGITCKGYTGPQTGYRIISMKNRSFSKSKKKTMYGHTEDLQTIKDLYLSTNNKSRSILITGDAGTGKTFLVNTFIDWAKSEKPELAVLTGKMFKYESFTNLYLWKDIITATVPGAHISQTDFSQNNARYFAEFREGLTKFAQKKPLIIFLDNIQWCDDVSMALIQSIVESPLDADITFIFASRQNEDIISFFASNIVPVLLVNPLSVKDAYFYTEEKLNLQEANPELILKVVNAAGGNPLFIDNMITELINSGTIIVNKNGTKTLSKSSSDKDEINIPTTMQNVILSRLSTLSYREQIVCKSASALGLKFNSSILMQILPEKMSQEEVDKMLADLVFHNIIDNDLVPDTFSFRTSYIHHIIYDTILETTKKEMNREILEVLENMYADDLSPYAEKLLFHAIEAQDNHKIYKYALAAAKNAELQFAFRDAMELYKTASEAANDFIKDKKSETIIQLQSSMKKTQLKLDEFDRSAGIVGKRPMVSRFTRLLQKFRNS